MKKQIDNYSVNKYIKEMESILCEYMRKRPHITIHTCDIDDVFNWMKEAKKKLNNQ